MRVTAIAAALLFLPLQAAAQSTPKRDVKKEVDALFHDFAGDVPGASVLVLRGGEVVLKKSYGFADLESRRAATPRTNYRLASVTKQFTATCILMLVERGKLLLDDPLTKFFPDFPGYGAEIRVRHMLNHTSGLPAYEDLMPEGTEPVVDADVLVILKKTDKPYFPPGTQFRYSNSGYSLLALIVEKISGMPFPDFLRRNIFKPLRMTGTTMNLRASPPAEARRAYGYSKRDKGWERTDQSRTSYVLGDGGIYSSIEDLAKWDRALLTTRLLRAETVAGYMLQATPTDEPGTRYGFGLYQGTYRSNIAMWHDGSSIGFRNQYFRVDLIISELDPMAGRPELGHLTVIVLTNRNDSDAAALARRIADLFF